MTDIELADATVYVFSLPDCPDKELLLKLVEDYRDYRTCGTAQECKNRMEWMSYSMDDVRVKFNQFCKAIRDEHEAELAYLREKSGLSTKRNGKVGRPRKTERHS